MRARYTYVFTTGGIGPTHDDITADAVAKAFGVAIDEDPRVLAMMMERYKPGELTPARRRMARIPAGAELVDNPVSRAPGFRIGNVIVMAGVPSVMQAMLDCAAKGLETGVKLSVETIEAGAIPEGRYGDALGDDRRRAWRDDHRLLSRPSPTGSSGTRSSCAAGTPRKSRRRAARSRRCSPRSGPTPSRCRPSRAWRPSAGPPKLLTDAASARPRSRRLLCRDRQQSRVQEAAMSDGREKAFPVSWDQFHRDARALAWRLAASGPFEAIVAVTRGGLVPAAIIARELELRVIETVCIASYHDYKNQGGLQVLKTIAAEVAKSGGGAKILVVDDLVDTGATAKVVREMLPKAHFATVYAKPLGRPLVDTFITEVSQDTWIYFPWDMGLAFQPPIAKDAAG